MNEDMCRLRGAIVDFKSGTNIRTRSARERFEVETIKKTLNVVLSELDAIVALAAMDKPPAADAVDPHAASQESGPRAPSGFPAWGIQTECARLREIARQSELALTQLREGLHALPTRMAILINGIPERVILESDLAALLAASEGKPNP